MKISVKKILGMSMMIVLLTSSLSVMAVRVADKKHTLNSDPKNETTDSLPYEGRLIIYVVEPLSRWNMKNGQPYHFGSLGTAFDTTLSIDYLQSYENNISWTGDATQDNVMVIAAVFNSDLYQGYSDPPDNDHPFDAHYVDAAAAVTPGNIGYNTANETFSHTVFIEEATATWCPYCPADAEALYTVYQSGEYPFYYVALIEDKSPNVTDRLNEYNLLGYPTVFFDGGYRIILGQDTNLNSYRSRIRTSGQRDVHDLNLTLSLTYLESGNLEIHVNITNNQMIHPPNTPAAPAGPTEGSVGIKYTFSTNTTDPDGGDLFYLFDWGDGTTSGWIGPVKPGKIATASHTWTEEGDYQVKVKAKDRGGHESNWSNPHTIHISPPDFILTVTGGFGITGTIVNHGNDTFSNVSWSLSVTGGILGRINVSSTGTIDSLAPDESVSVKLESMVVGFGKISIKVKVETTTWPVTGFIFGPIIIVSKSLS